ncbi:MAG: hypothetical protein A2583_07680 [Bdellovibrionales bacterium RIFOXYD1_FULL_53_11]|nr:MAG: hypothetical protein A2583_07680 [Bdellovibrionales bacterium RIFOXYD1_FULL_53_11]
MNKQIQLLAVAVSFGVVYPLFSGATLRPDKIHTADARKTDVYITDGVFTGGDRAVDDVIVKDIRRSPNPGYERIVIDITGNRAGDSTAIKRAPYYQVAFSPEEKRIMFTIWGKPKLAFDAGRVVAAFKKSRIVSAVELFPKLEDGSWTFVLGLKNGRQLEVFELTDPARIIADIRPDRRKH